VLEGFWLSKRLDFSPPTAQLLRIEWLLRWSLLRRQRIKVRFDSSTTELGATFMAGLRLRHIGVPPLTRGYLLDRGAPFVNNSSGVAHSGPTLRSRSYDAGADEQEGTDNC
jgi:hypothetical protein